MATEKDYMDISAHYAQLQQKEHDFSHTLQLLEDVDLNVCNASGDTLYHLAALYLDVKLVDFLAEQGVKPTHNNHGLTPLHTVLNIFSWEDKAQKIKELTCALINAGVNFKRKDESGKTLTVHCVEKVNWAVLEPLIKTGIKLDVIAEEGKNLLHLVCYRMQLNKTDKRLIKNGTEIIKLLLEHGGIDPEDKDIFGATPVTYLQRANLLEVAALFYDDEEDKHAGGMEIDQAVILKNHEAVKWLLDKGEDANAISEKYGNKSLLMIACERADDKMVDLLLDAGADPNYRSGSGLNSVHFLLKEGFGHIRDVPPGKMPPQMQNILRSLKKKGWLPSESCDDHGNTALHYVASGHYMMDTDEAMLEWLLDLGCAPDSANLDGQTPLMLHAMSGDENKHALAEWLLDAGARVGFCDKKGQTALHHAAKNTQHMSALNIARQIIDKDKSILSCPDNASKTAMDYAADTNNEPLVKLLLTF